MQSPKKWEEEERMGARRPIWPEYTGKQPHGTAVQATSARRRCTMDADSWRRRIRWTRMMEALHEVTSRHHRSYLPTGTIDSDVQSLMRVDVCHHVLRPCCIDKARGHLGMIKLVQRFATKRRCQ